MALWSNLKCVWNRKWWVSTAISSGDKGLWSPSRSFLPERSGPTGLAWSAASQTGRTASALTALSKGRLRTWMITGKTADSVFLAGWLSSDVSFFASVPANGAWNCPSVLHRPFFTYWITFVHLLITILAVTIYGIAPVGFSQHETVDSVSKLYSVYYD